MNPKHLNNSLYNFCYSSLVCMQNTVVMIRKYNLNISIFSTSSIKSMKVVHIHLQVMDGEQYLGIELIACSQVCDIRFTMPLAGIAFAIGVQRGQLFLQLRSELVVCSILLSYKSLLLFSQQERIIDFKDRNSKFKSVLDILYFAKTSQAQNVLLLITLPKPTMDCIVYSLSFQYCLFVAKIANNKAIHFMVQYLFETAVEQTNIFGPMNGSKNFGVLMRFFQKLTLLQICCCLGDGSLVAFVGL